MSYLDDIATPANLRAALANTVQRRGAPGPDGVTVDELQRDAELQLTLLREELLAGTYRPRAARRVDIPKPGGGYRQLAISCVRDRVVQHAAAAILSDRLDPLLHDCAFAYRRGRSVQQALAAVDAALAAGLHWIVRADIEQFFDHIDPTILLAALRQATGEAEVVALVENLLTGGVLAGGEIADLHVGTPQGSPLSPFLANLYLLPFDRTLAAAGHRMVRYADDLCLNLSRRDTAEAALDLIRHELEKLRLQLNPHKVEIRHLGEGFDFLGFHFISGGRRPGRKALRQVSAKLAALAADASAGATDELTEMLRGWLDYYGSLAGVDVPASLRQRAAELEAERAQAKVVQGVTLTSTPAEGSLVITPAVGGRWLHAAQRLAACSDAEAESALASELNRDLSVDAALWPRLDAALRAFDGAAAAEILATAGRFGDAMEVARLIPPTVATPAPETNDPPPAEASPVATATMRASAPPVPGAPSVDESAEHREVPRLDVHGELPHLLLERFSGADHTYLRQQRGDDGVRSERLAEPLDEPQLRDHLAGVIRVGVFPLRRNNTVRFAAVRVVLAAKVRKGLAVPTELPTSVASHTGLVREALVKAGVSCLVSREPGRGFVVWLPFAEPVGAARARALVTELLARLGPPPPEIVCEVVPAQDVAKVDKPGTAIPLPLGVELRSGERAWLCDAALQPEPDPARVLRDLVATPVGLLAPRRRAAGSEAVATVPFQEKSRALAVYQGCNVVRHFIDEAMRGEGLSSGERYLVADALGRLGDEAEPALDAVLRHLVDYRPGLAARTLARLYPNPSSCGRIRERLPELTQRVGCDCRFRLVPGAYPTPALHAVGAAELPGLKERVHEAAVRGGIARAARAEVNAGHEALGARAAALCTRLADLRRQARAVERAIAAAEQELDRIVDQAGDDRLETASGTLRRLRDGEQRRFVLEV